MFKSKRIQQIQEYVLQHKTASLDELVSVFDVSKNTIRRDVQWLVDHGEVTKVYGGVAANNSTLVSFTVRQARHEVEKKRIGQLAAEFVNDGDVIFIDSGTTTCEMFPFLKDKAITILTHNLTVIVNSLPYENLRLLVIGGELERTTNSFTPATAPDLLKTYNIHKAFMASTGISIANGVTNASPLETEIKQLAVSRSAEVFLLVDHTKFDTYGLVTYCNLDDIDTLVTDAVLSGPYQQFVEEHAIRLVT